jgi:hypothetical protein
MSHFFSCDNILIVDIQTTAGAIFGQLDVGCMRKLILPQQTRKVLVYLDWKRTSAPTKCVVGTACKVFLHFKLGQLKEVTTPADVSCPSRVQLHSGI